MLEGGGRSYDIDARLRDVGRPSTRADNAVLVCHALTGDTHAAGRAGPGHPEGWWDGVGPGQAIDTDRWFVVAANVLGGQGTTGPASPHRPGRPLRLGFPVVTVRDMVRTQARLADAPRHRPVGRR